MINALKRPSAVGLRRTVLAGIVWFGVVSSAWPASDELRITADQATASAIETAPVERESESASAGFPAQILIPPQQLQVVSAPLPGLLEQVLVTSHQTVRKGQVVARLQSPGLADLQHTYLQAATQVSLARSNLERDEALYAEGIIARSRLLATRAHLNEVSADLAERTQALRLAGMSDAALSRLRSGRGVNTAIDLVAPLDGVVLEQLASSGQRLEAAAPVMKIAWLEPLWIEIQVPVAKLGEFRDGARVRAAGGTVGGRVISIGRNLNPANQTVVVRAEITHGASALRVGEFIEASVDTTVGAGERWSVPGGALARVGSRTVIFVQTADGFRAQTVEIAREGAVATVVTGRLREGDRIAVKGVSTLKARLTGVGVE